jgi:hypothetical protein
MQIIKLLTEINNYLPSYEFRIIFLLFLTCITVLLLIFYFLRKKIKRKFIIALISALFLPIYLSLPIYLFFNGDTYEKYLTQEFVIITTAYLVILISTTIFLTLLSLKRDFVKIFLWFQLVIYIIVVILLLVVSLFTEPKVYVQGANNEGVLEEASGITVSFSVPMNKDLLNIHISPETETNLSYNYIFNSSKWISSYTVQPKKSFLPEQKVVIYTTGITRLFPYGIKHENSQEFFTPTTPTIEEVVLGTDTNNVPINEGIVVELDSKDQQFVEWEALFEPTVEYEIKRDSSNKIIIMPLNLKQGTQYKLSLYRNIIQYDTQTYRKISQESHELIEEFSFRTIPAPGLLSFNREGEYISNKDPLILNFESPIQEETIKGRFSLSPQIEGNITLSEDKKQILFTPSSEFQKNTEYTATISKGIMNTLGGYIEEDIQITFKTAGYVKMSSSSPWNGAKNIDISTRTLSITFDQPVSKESVEKGWSITPSVNGTFSWRENTVYYTLANNLSYGTKYTITIPAGIVSIYGYNSNTSLTTSFTTKYETVRLNVPQYYQTESFTCNLAATRMVLGYKGISSTESGIKSAIGIGENPLTSWVDGYGVHAGPISSYISSRGVSNTIKSGWNLTSALQEVKNGHPVILYVYNGYSQPYGSFELPGGYTGYKGMHSEVIVGFVGKPEAPQTVYTNDPWRGPRTYTPSSLLGKWAYLGYTAIVIY